MEVEKRKRLEDGELIDQRKKVMMMKSVSKIEADDDDEKKKAAVVVVGRDHDGGDDDKEDDGEVEEFFEILKRIRVAVKYFEKGVGGERRRRETMVGPRAWNPSFEREDFDGFKVEKGSEESVEQNAVLDLNADPADT